MNIKKRILNKKTGRLFFTGASMGVADLIPGVSSGTIAFLYGVYDELLYTIRVVTGPFPRLFFKGKFKEAFKLIPFSFALPLGVGMLLAIFSAVQLISYLLETQAIYIWSVFFGLVFGSAIVISKRIRDWTLSRVIYFLLGLTVVFLVVGLPAVETAHGPLITLGTGTLASMAMILPGVSGTLLMVLLGQYEYIIDAISNFDVATLSIFIVGIIIGFGLFARLVAFLLRKYHSAVIATLTGAILGSLRAVWPWQDGVSVNYMPALDLSLALAIVLMIAGFALVFLLQRIGVAEEGDFIDTPGFKEEVKSQQD